MEVSIRVFCWMLCGALTCTVQARAQGQALVKSARDFVQEFYAWYVPRALKAHEGPAWDLALEYKAHAFSPELLRALKADSDAQAKVSGEIVGLDFDPFLNTQDPCERYECGTVAKKGGEYWINVYGICSGKRSETPDVVVELMPRGDGWEFVNFHYENLIKDHPASADLLAILRLLRRDRRESRK